jgi:sugar/nucleoside kinase (ribokinase family)
MTQYQYDVTAIGNAIVDMLSQTDDGFLHDQSLNKGTMTLIDDITAKNLFDIAGTVTQQSGGSAANTVAGIASFGGRCAYIGKVSHDELGEVFRHDMISQGIDYDTAPGDETLPSTARCMIFVTPDAERTMATYLGVSTELAPDDLDARKIQQAKVTYLEGYLFDKELAKEAFHAAAMIAHMAGSQVALTLSDPFCVNRHREDFLKLIDGHIDILFANEQELLTLYQTDDFDAAMEKISQTVDVCAVTQGAKGATIIMSGETYFIPALNVENVVDTTGAGDLFAAGFLYGYTRGLSPEECGAIGVKAASEIITHVGARPQKQLKTLLAA